MNKRSAALVLVILSLATLCAYLPLRNHAFVEFDDPSYIVQNAHVQQGVTWSSVVWAFTTGHASNWHPLTWISHMVDFELYGLNPGGHHLMSLLLHVLNSCVLFLLMQRMTGHMWRSALTAALFAWHPLHVESVSWAAERKDVLSTFFFLLTLGAYVSYVRTKGAEAVPGNRQATRQYALSLVLFAFGLMSKPMLVTAPFVLLLLDVWPLGRLSSDLGRATAPALRRLLMEKFPFFVLSAAASIATFLVQRSGGAVSSFETVSLGDRIANASVAYVRYLGKTMWPTDLAAFYPLPDSWPTLVVIACAFLLALASVGVFLLRRTHPYLMVGWFWFVGTLVPTIGIVQVGSQAMADRYTYIPSIGLFMAFAWGLGDLKRQCFRLQWSIPAVAGLSAVACVAVTSIQVQYWRDEETLFRHAASCAPGNYLAYDHLAKVCEAAGRKEEALAFYRELLALKPRYPEGNYNAGILLMELGRLSEAEGHFRQAAHWRSQFSEAHMNLGVTLVRQGRLGEAVDELSLATRLNPRNSDGHLNLGLAYLGLQRPAEAAKAFENCVSLSSDSPEAHFLYAVALGRDRQFERAALEAQKARQLASSAGRADMAQKADKFAQACQNGDLSTASL